MAQKIKSNLISKALWVLKNRPMQFLSNLRSYWLFSRTRFLWKILGPSEKQVSLGKNVRIERFRCLLADGTSTHIEVGDHSVIYEKAKVQAFGNGHISIGSCCVLSDVRISLAPRFESAIELSSAGMRLSRISTRTPPSPRSEPFKWKMRLITWSRTGERKGFKPWIGTFQVHLLKSATMCGSEPM
jgi:hypothetical protein